MDTITKAMLFGGSALVSVIDAKDIAKDVMRLHKPSKLAGSVLARTLAMTAFMSAGFKGVGLKMSVAIEGDGALGKIIACGKTGGVVRGYIENKDVTIDDCDEKLAIAKGIGMGNMTVIKDFGMKDPYVGKCELLKSDIDSDFAYYFTASEQLPSAVASGCVIENGKVLSCGAIIVQPMPNCDEEKIFILEDIVSNFTDFGAMLKEKSAQEIIDFYFGHFECKTIDVTYPKYECICSKERMDKIVRSLGYDEAKAIVHDQGQIEIHCDFCNEYYRYDMQSVNKLFGR